MIFEWYTKPDLLNDELTPQKIALVQDSWFKVIDLGEETVGRIIFKNLFTYDPELLQLFPFSMYDDYEDTQDYLEHITKVVGVVSKAVENLVHFDDLVAILASIGQGHVPRGVKPEDYDTLGKAVL